MRTGMAVGQVVKPGRTEDAVALAGEAAKLFERLGAESVAYRFGGAGTQAGSAMFSFEAPSQRAMGELLDRMQSDGEYQTFMSRVTAPDAPADMGQIVSYSVLDTGLPEGAPGSVGSIVTWRPAPGRAADAIALATDAGHALLRLGASSTRVVQITSGQGLPIFASATESASFAAQGAWRDALATDEGWQAIAARLAAPDAPGQFLDFSEWSTAI